MTAKRTACSVPALWTDDRIFCHAGFNPSLANLARLHRLWKSLNTVLSILEAGPRRVKILVAPVQVFVLADTTTLLRWIETGLVECPPMTLVTILCLLFTALPTQRINREHVW